MSGHINFPQCDGSLYVLFYICWFPGWSWWLPSPACWRDLLSPSGCPVRWYGESNPAGFLHAISATYITHVWGGITSWFIPTQLWQISRTFISCTHASMYHRVVYGTIKLIPLISCMGLFLGFLLVVLYDNFWQHMVADRLLSTTHQRSSGACYWGIGISSIRYIRAKTQLPETQVRNIFLAITR